jgi:hypothetical protein
MTQRPTLAERLDRAVQALLDGASAGQALAGAGLGEDERTLVLAAQAAESALVAPLVSPRFEARLGARLSSMTNGPWILRHPGRLIVTGAVGSAVGVGVTAYAVWRSGRRPAPITHRLLQR